jgi:Fe2+ transport system protein FeoA
MKIVEVKNNEATNTAEERLLTMGELDDEEVVVPNRAAEKEKLKRQERLLKTEIKASIEALKGDVAIGMT